MTNKNKMVKFKAKIEGENEWFEGNSLIFEISSNRYVISNSGIEWVDGSEWRSGYTWEYIEIDTLIITQ